MELKYKSGDSYLSVCNNTIKIKKGNNWYILDTSCQIYVNGSWQYLTCPTIFRTIDVQKNDCGSGKIGSTVTYNKAYANQAAADGDTSFASDAQAYANANGTCSTVTTQGIGVLVIDFQYSNNPYNFAAFINTPSTIPYQQIVSSGNYFLPNNGTDAAQCWALASDIKSTNPSVRFEINTARLKFNYPNINQFTIDIVGRAQQAGNVLINYSLKGAAQGNMIMSGTEGNYLPSVANSSNLGTITGVSVPVVGGADGTYGINVGARIARFIYDAVNETITVS